MDTSGSLRKHYVLFDDLGKIPAYLREKYPELRPNGWASILVPRVVRQGEDIGHALVRMEDEAKEVATQFFGDAWTYVSSSLSEDDFLQGEFLRIEYQYATGTTDGYAITKRQRWIDLRHEEYAPEEGVWEDVTGLALLMMSDSVFAKATEIEPARVAADLRRAAARLDQYAQVDLPQIIGVSDSKAEVRSTAALVREAAKIIEESENHEYC